MRGALLLALLAGCTAANPTYDRHLAELCDRTGNCRPDLLGYTRDAGAAVDAAVDAAPRDLWMPPPDLMPTCAEKQSAHACKTDDDCCGAVGACTVGVAGFRECCRAWSPVHNNTANGNCGPWLDGKFFGQIAPCCPGLVCRAAPFGDDMPDPDPYDPNNFWQCQTPLVP